MVHHCFICSDIFVKPTDLTEHLREVHKLKNGSKFECKDCDRSYQNANSFRKHLKEHSEQNYLNEKDENVRKDFNQKFLDSNHELRCGNVHKKYDEGRH